MTFNLVIWYMWFLVICTQFGFLIHSSELKFAFNVVRFRGTHLCRIPLFSTGMSTWMLLFPSPFHLGYARCSCRAAIDDLLSSSLFQLIHVAFLGFSCTLFFLFIPYLCIVFFSHTSSVLLVWLLFFPSSVRFYWNVEENTSSFIFFVRVPDNESCSLIGS